MVNTFDLLITQRTLTGVWRDPGLLHVGLLFSVSVLFILLAHELGHYLACRYYRLPSTPPYFVPAPFAVGTLGAFIRIKAPVPDKRRLFDVGIAGPLAGFVALLPFLLYGVWKSQPAPVQLGPGEVLIYPGRCLALELATRLFHGRLDDGMVLNLHPFVLGAWFGLLATALNLIPLGQFDGGHILHAVSRKWQRRLALPIWLGLAATGLLWPGWWLWCVIVLVIGPFHPPVRDEATPLDPRRRRLALAALVVLLLSFTPEGLRIIDDPSATAAAPGSRTLVRFQKSATKVTGPSLTNATSM